MANRHNETGLLFETNYENGNDLQEQLISNEENYIANILLKCLKMCPSSFGKQNIFVFACIKMPRLF